MSLEKHARLFDEKQRRWHVNRKEFYWLHRTIRHLVCWAKAFPPSSHHIRGIVVYCDNTTAAAWGSAQKPRKYDIQAVHRLQDDISDLLTQCKEELGVSIKVCNIAGYLNDEADKLSRLGSSLDVLPDLSEITTSVNKKVKSLDTFPSCVVFSRDTDCALITPPFSHVDPGRMVVVPDPAVDLSNTDLGLLQIGDSLPVAVAHVDIIKYDDLTGVADMSEADLLVHSMLHCIVDRHWVTRIIRVI